MNFEAALNNFVRDVQLLINETYRNNYPNLKSPKIEVDICRKYVKVIEKSSDSRTRIFCFVNKENGDILKAATFKQPAKIARGNIYKDYKDAITPYGAKYLR